MKSAAQKRTSAVLASLLVATFVVAVFAQYGVDRIRVSVRPQEVLYIPSAKTLKRMSLGYSGLMADIYWTRAVQYFGWKHRNLAMDYKLLFPLLDITTDLDPQLLVAYRFGAFFVAQKPPAGAGEPDKAAALIEKGIKHNPDNWRLYYDLGFLHAMDRHDYMAAAKAFEAGSKLPNAHPSLRILAALMASKGGDLETSRMMWQMTLESATNPSIKENAIEHLRALEVDEVVPILEQRIQQYKASRGALPGSWLDMVKAGYLKRAPLDPAGNPYKLREDGTVVVQEPHALPFIRKGLPENHEPVKRDVL